jgi:hypothetical protein
MRWKQDLTSTFLHLPTTFDHLLRPLGNATRANGIAHLHRGNLAGALIERRSKSGLRRNLRSGRGFQSSIFTFWACLAIALFRSGTDGFHLGFSCLTNRTCQVLIASLIYLFGNRQRSLALISPRSHSNTGFE